MQIQKKISKLILALAVSSLCGCDRDQEFQELIDSSRRGTLAQVYPVGKGLPFYTEKTLTPIWDEGEKIVRMPEISMKDQNGKTRTENLFEGKVTFVGFFFASCKGFCPVLIRNIKKIDLELKDQKNIQFVMLTVDPDHDVPSVLREYSKTHQLGKWADWFLLTGSREKTYEIARETFVSQTFRRQTPEEERNFAHSEHVYMIDGKGRLRGVLNATRVDVAREARELIRKLGEEKPQGT